MSVCRLGVSLEKDLLEQLDRYVADNCYPNRSQAVRALIEKYTVEEKWHCNNVVAGAIVLVYNHQKGDISSKSYDIQHAYFDVILSVQHFHLSHDNCLEIIAVRGIASRLTELSEKLLSRKGIIHGKLVMSKTK